MDVNNNFVGSKMNKSLDERLVPQGSYIDALNIRISSDEDGEAGSAENAKGNELMAQIQYNGADIDSLSKTTCIGAYEDGTNETIYWFLQSSVVDMIVSFNTDSEAITYHVISTSVLNFSADHPMGGIDLIDGLLFFTDNYNQPRRINVNESYLQPIGGVDQITEDDISVIVKPPVEAPLLEMVTNATDENYIEDKFIRFSYRYKYKNGEYSALSDFTQIAFEPGTFDLNYANYDNDGMRNRYNQANLTINTGPANVVGIDICFKLSNSNVVNVIEKFNKEDLGWNDDSDEVVSFNNQKIYTKLSESELLRLYDNVPRYAKTQTTMGNRIVYGNYIDGYDIDTVIDYDTELISEFAGTGTIPVTESFSSNQGSFSLDLSNVDLIEGTTISIDLNILHNSFTGNAAYDEPINEFQRSWSFQFTRTFDDVEDLANSTEFLSSIQLTDLWTNTDDGYSLTDIFFSSITPKPGWNKIKGVDGTNSESGFSVSYLGNIITINNMNVQFEDPTDLGNYAYEVFYNADTDAFSFVDSLRKSWHSNRDYEVSVDYMDEYNRCTTALVSENNTVFVPAANSTRKNTIRVSMNHLAPSWAKRYRFSVKPSKGNYETIYSNLYFFDSDQGSWWIKLEGDNQTKAKEGDMLIVKSDSNGPTTRLIRTKILELTTKERNLGITGLVAPPGAYMRLKANNFSVTTAQGAVISRNAVNSSPYIPAVIHSMYEDNPLFGNPGELEYREISIPAGSTVKFDLNLVRFISNEIRFNYSKTYQATEDYDSLYDFIVGENINFDTPLDQKNPDTLIGDFDYIIKDSDNVYLDLAEEIVPLSTAPYLDSYSLDFYANDYPDVMKYSYARDTDGRGWLILRTGVYGSTNHATHMDCSIQITKSGGLLIFETEPAENTGEIYYQGSKSYEINSSREHMGSIQDQVSGVSPAIIDLETFNCFAFGNGVESYKIGDALATPGFRIGARTTAVSEQDYKEAYRYADLTYSGIHNEETNINKLNEFNLGLQNFKTLEKSFGPINKIHGRQTDILVLQEDKISYVLGGKNLLSDAGAGGAIVNTPEVLGTQISRIEEIGISNDTQSFASYGSDVFFTDSKRGIVVNLKGGSYQEQLNIISNFGMRSWFRDTFIDNFKTEKLGGYDPYMNEYVLTFK